MNVFDMARQVHYLINNGMSSDEALQKIENVNISKSSNDLNCVKSLFNPGTAYDVSSEKLHHRKNLKILMDITDYQNGDRSKLFTGFYNKFVRNESDYDMSIFDISGLLFYLMSIVAIASFCVAIYSIFVLPEFESLFAGFGQELPVLTSLILTITGEYGALVVGLILLVIIGIFLTVMHVKTTLKSLKCFSSKMVKIPLLGTIIKKYNQYLQLSFIQLLIDSGLQVGQAIEEVSKKIGDDLFLRQDLNGAVVDIPALKVAHELGTFSEEVDYQLTRLRLQGVNNFTQIKSIISVLSIIIVATVVGSVIIAMYLPIFEMGKIIG